MSHTIRTLLGESAKMRTSAGPMKDRRAPRGGAFNAQRDILDGFEADQAEGEIEVLPADINPWADESVDDRGCGCSICKYNLNPEDYDYRDEED